MTTSPISSVRAVRRFFLATVVCAFAGPALAVGTLPSTHSSLCTAFAGKDNLDWESFKRSVAPGSTVVLGSFDADNFDSPKPVSALIDRAVVSALSFANGKPSRLVLWNTAYWKKASYGLWLPAAALEKEVLRERPGATALVTSQYRLSSDAMTIRLAAYPANRATGMPLAEFELQLPKAGIERYLDDREFLWSVVQQASSC